MQTTDMRPLLDDDRVCVLSGNLPAMTAEEASRDIADLRGSGYVSAFRGADRMRDAIGHAVRLKADVRDALDKAPLPPLFSWLRPARAAEVRQCRRELQEALDTAETTHVRSAGEYDRFAREAAGAWRRLPDHIRWEATEAYDQKLQGIEGGFSGALLRATRTAPTITYEVGGGIVTADGTRLPPGQLVDRLIATQYDGTALHHDGNALTLATWTLVDRPARWVAQTRQVHLATVTIGDRHVTFDGEQIVVEDRGYLDRLRAAQAAVDIPHAG